jgi:PKD repeat protein
LTNAAIIQYRTKGTGATAWERYLSIKPYSSTPTELKFRIDSLYTDKGGNIKISDDGFYGTFTTSWLANCQAKSDTTELEYDFVFQNQGILGNALDTVNSGIYTDKILYTKPEVLLSAANSNVYADQDTVEWEIRIKNNSTTDDVPFAWLGAYKTQNVRLVDVVNSKTNKSVTKYNDIFIINSVNKSGQQDYKIRAVFKDCNRDSLLLQFGSNCTAYPDSISAYPCNTIPITLYFEPINTRLEAIMKDTATVVDLCEEKQYNIEIRNTGSPKVFNSYLDLLLRPGMVLSDTAWLKVEGRTDSVAITNPVNVAANTYRWQLAAQDSVLNNSGLNGVKSSTGYIMHLRFGLTTDCNFTSSTFFLLRPGGTLRCGQPVNSAYTVGEPIDIKNVVKPYYSAVSLDMIHLDACNFNGTSMIKFINLGPDTTGNNDRILVSLPPGIEMDTTYIGTGHNPSLTSAKYKFVNGENTYSWFIPSGIVPGDSSQFVVSPILKNNDLSCGLKQIFTQAVITQPVLCIADSTYCDINVATSAALLTDSVEKSSFSMVNISGIAQPNGSNEKITLNYTISNAGTDKANGNALKVDLYYDTNKNGVIDSGDVYLNSDTILSEIKKGGSLTHTTDFIVSSSYVCNLMLYVSDSNCVCEASWAVIPPPRLLNAGNDTIACPGEPFTIGNKGSATNTYSWSPGTYLSEIDSAQTIFTGKNVKTSNDTLKLVLTTQRSGCSSSDTVQIILFPGMSANFADSVNLCKGDRVILGDVISGGVGRVKLYQWTPTDSLSKPQGQLTFANPIVSTNYTFTSIDNAGCVYKDSTYVTVINKPIALMQFTDTCAREFVKVSNTSNYQGTTPDSLHWTFGNLYESQLNNFQVFVDSAQQIKIDLYVENSKGCWDTASGFTTIFPLPIANAATYEDCQFDTTTLQAISTIEYGNLTHQWKIKGNTYSGDALQFNLQNETSIPFELRATSDQGCIDVFYDTLQLRNKPEISITVNDVCLVDSAQFSVSIAGSTTENITSYSWDLGDGSNQSTASFNHKYADTGTYTLTLMASNAFGCSDTANATVMIHPMPISSFTKQNICLDQTAEFFDKSTIPKGNIQSIYWDFGSGFILGDTNLSLSKNATGTYTVRHKVISNQGCADSSSNTFDVYYIEYPKAIIVGNCENQLIQITALPQRTDSISAIQWNVLQDSFSTAAFSYLFQSSGLYSAVQTITTKQGCTSDSTFSIKIDPAPIAAITMDKVCDDNVAEFSGNGITNKWDLGDGTTASTANVSHTYLARGSYPIELIVNNVYNCLDTANATLEIENIVIADFEVSDIC